VLHLIYPLLGVVCNYVREII